MSAQHKQQACGGNTRGRPAPLTSQEVGVDLQLVQDVAELPAQLRAQLAVHHLVLLAHLALRAGQQGGRGSDGVGKVPAEHAAACAAEVPLSPANLQAPASLPPSPPAPHLDGAVRDGGQDEVGLAVDLAALGVPHHEALRAGRRVQAVLRDVAQQGERNRGSAAWPGGSLPGLAVLAHGSAAACLAQGASPPPTPTPNRPTLSTCVMTGG